MKKLNKLSVLAMTLAAFALALGMNIVPSQAQQKTDHCYGLNTADCALVEGSVAPDALHKLTSFNDTYEFEIKASDNAQITFDLASNGSGALQFKPENFLQMFAGGTASVLDNLMLQSTLTNTLTLGANTHSGSLEVRIVNGTLYIQGDQATGGQWRSIDLKTLAQRRGFRRAGGGMLGTFNIREMIGLFVTTQKLLATPGLVTASRAADMTIDNQSIAVFVYTVDLPTLFSSPLFPELLTTIVAAQGRGNKISSDEITMLSQELATAFKGSTFTITRLVGTQDKLAHGLGVDLNASIDPQTLSVFPGGGGAGKTSTPVAIGFHFLVKLSAVGAPVSVTAPTNAQPFDLGPTETGTPEATESATESVTTQAATETVTAPTAVTATEAATMLPTIVPTMMATAMPSAAPTLQATLQVTPTVTPEATQAATQPATQGASS